MATKKQLEPVAPAADKKRRSKPRWDRSKSSSAKVL